MFIVIEMQTNGGKVATIINRYTDLNQAYQKYYTVLAAAAVSNVEVHTAVILTETGKVVASEHFAHETKAETEVEEVE